jgi:hypothetical protein
MRLGRFLIVCLIVLVGVFLLANEAAGTAAAGAITAAALFALVVIAALMLRSSGRLSEEGLRELMSRVPSGQPPQ